MTEEFKRQFDALENIEKAASLAYTLGYDEAYLDGATITSPTYSNVMRLKITSLCGTTDWPEKVMQALNEGAHNGYMDT